MAKKENLNINKETGEILENGNALTLYNDETDIVENMPNQYITLDDEDFVGQLLGQQIAYTSYNLETLDVKTKALYFNAVNNTPEKIRVHANSIIWVKDIYVTIATIKQKDGTLTKAPRTVLIDKNGIGYGAVSIGVWQSIKNLIASYGEPNTWKDSLPLKVNLIPKDEFMITSLSIDIESL